MTTCRFILNFAVAAVSPLKRRCDEAAILRRAQEFSYSPFKERLAKLLSL